MCQENLLYFDTVNICKRWGFLNVYLDPNTYFNREGWASNFSATLVPICHTAQVYMQESFNINISKPAWNFTYVPPGLTFKNST